MSGKAPKRNSGRPTGSSPMGPAATQVPSTRVKVLVLSALLCLTLIAFLPSLSNSFITWDDPEYVHENPHLRDFDLSTVFSTFFAGNYHPLTLLWLYLESMIFPAGDPALFNGHDPFWYHLHNLVLHLANTALVFFLVLGLAGPEHLRSASFAALLFGVHPMHVESVAWVSATKDLVYTLFYVSSLLAYIHYITRKRRRFLAVSLILFVLSLLAKGQAVTLPVILFLIDLYKARRVSLATVLEKLPFLALSIIFGLIAIEAQKSASAINPDYQGLDSLYYASYGLLAYVKMCVLPLHLSGAHPYPVNPGLEELPASFHALPIGVIAAAVLVYFLGKSSRCLYFGTLFHVITISIVLKFIPVGDCIIAERYTYVSYIGLFFIAGQSFAELRRRVKLKRVVDLVALAMVLALAVGTWQRTTAWKDTITFWSDVAEKYPEYWRPCTCIAQEYEKIGTHALRSGDSVRANDFFTRALKQYSAACERDRWAPPVPYMLRGALHFYRLGHHEAAIRDFRAVLAFPNKNDRSQLDARHMLGLVYTRAGKHRKAVDILDEAIRMAPEHPVGHHHMGLAAVGLRDFKRAEAAFTRAIALNPEYVQVLMDRGVFYTDNVHDFDKGIADYEKVLRLQPGHRNAMINIGICLFNQNRFDEALQQYEKCLRLPGRSGRIYYLRALAYAKKNRFGKAYRDGLRAKELGITIDEDVLREWKEKDR